MANVINNLFKNALKTKFSTQQVRCYPRWSHRRPLKVYTSEEYEQLEQTDKNPEVKKGPNVPIFDKYGGSKITWEHTKPQESKSDKLEYKVKPKKSLKRLKPLVANHQQTKKTVDMLETVIDKDGNFIYSKMSNNDQRVGMILTEVKSKKEKEKKDLILLEGKRLIRDALKSGCHLKYIIFSRKEEVEYLKPVLPQIGAKLYKMPYKEMQMWSDLTTTPGIMGIFKTPNVEEFQSKEALPFTVICDNVREPGNLGTILRICAAAGCERVILTKGCVNLWDTKVLRSAVGAHFQLKILKNLEWSTIEEEIGDDSNVFLADNRLISDSGESEDDLVTILEKIPLLPYYAIDFKSYKHTILIVGGETLGISKTSYELAMRKNGARLNIPLSGNVDSLNVGAALGIIVFELRKQLALLVNK